MLAYQDARLSGCSTTGQRYRSNNTDARLFGCPITGKRFRRDDMNARQLDARNIVAQFLNAFSIGFVLSGDQRNTIADLILTGG